MLIINQAMNDIRRLAQSGLIPSDLASHLDKKVRRLHEALEPETPLEDFCLEAHGLIGILEKGDRSLKEIGMPEDLSLIMPEWISRLTLPESGNVFILYVMATNDEVIQVYLPEDVMPDAVRLWLSEQPLEEEAEGGEEDENRPVPF